MNETIHHINQLFSQFGNNKYDELISQTEHATQCAALAKASGATPELTIAALLHDIGKTVSDLGWFMRIAATVCGPRGAAFAMYHDHETIGAQMLQGKSEQRTIDLVAGTVDNAPIKLPIAVLTAETMYTSFILYWFKCAANLMFF